jgi:DNA-binding GntR family transcriptional regulator
MTAANRAYAYTKDRILDGRFPGGELISEGDVADGVEVSRTPVREAFLRLESEGLLRLFPKRGALIVPVSRLEVDNVMETRMLVERYAIGKVIEREVDLGERLEEAMVRLEEIAAKDGYRGDFVEADREFHRIFVAESGNTILLSLYDSMRDRQSRMGLAALARDDDRIRRILLDHRVLAKAVVAGDTDRAQEVLDRHLRETLALLRDQPTLAAKA